ncbi:hypothetical protein D3C71_1359070 [compost metagenome]
MEGLLHRHGQIARVFDEEIVFDDGAGNTDRVALLEGIQPNGGRGHLSGNDHHRDAVHVRRSDTGHCVGETWTGCDQRNTHFTRGAGVAVSSVYGSLLMAHQHVLDGVLFVERVVDVENCTAGIAPDVLNVLSLKRLDEDLGTHEVLSTGNGGDIVALRSSGS